MSFLMYIYRYVYIYVYIYDGDYLLLCIHMCIHGMYTYM